MKAKATKIISSLILLLALTTVNAQQDPNHALYRYNMNLINPAHAGAHEASELGVNIRSLWSGVAGAPETQSVFFSTSAGNNVGLGATIINDKTFIENQTYLGIDFSYKIKLNLNTDLYFGIKAGASSYNANTDGLTTFGIGSDPSLMDLDGRFQPNIGAGLHLKTDKYFFSFSIPKILTPERLEQNDGLARLGTDRIHMYLVGGYDFDLNNDLIFKPSILARYIDSSPFSIEFTAAFNINRTFELAAAYRLDEGLGGYIIIDAADWVDFGYAYESAYESPIAKSSNGTHEVFMKFKL